MSLRLRLVLAIVGLSLVVASSIGMLSLRGAAEQSLAGVDDALREAVSFVESSAVGRPGLRGERGRRELRDRLLGSQRRQGETELTLRGRTDLIVQLLDDDGAAVASRGVPLPVDDADLTVVAGARGTQRLRTVELAGEPHRVLTAGLGRDRGAVQVARSLAEHEQVLAHLRGRILAASAAVAATAALVGWLIAHQVTRRLVRLTEAAERVTETGELGVRVLEGADEAGRLGGAFNEMLSTLDRSRRDQQRLVEDAGHELRTPLTSVRTNVFALRRADELSPSQRASLLADLEAETEELARLVDEIVGLATDRADEEELRSVDLGALVQRVVARASSRSGRRIKARVDDTTVLGRPVALARAVTNLVENALKFDDGEHAIEVSCAAGVVEVHDHGPGIAAADLPHVFDRFYRADDARRLPGSGLGLSIVAEVVRSHGGTVVARAGEGGGAVVGFQLPTTR